MDCAFKKLKFGEKMEKWWKVGFLENEGNGDGFYASEVVW
jgi:hypothetical protein